MDIWTEKYRPSTFEGIKGQDKIVSRVKAMVKQKNIGNFLFAGPAGVGKSTLAIVIGKELYGANWRSNFLELNASDERGIDVVRGIIKDFARTKSLGENFKIIFLDECDSLTKEAQQALRRTMENFTQNTRFILSCNYSSKIIDPIMSRCIVFRFKPLEKDDLKKIIEDIAKKENLDLEKGVVDILHEISGGDVRRVENILQSCAALSKKITKELVYDLVGIAQPKEIKEILELVTMKKDFVKARERLLDTMLKHGLNGMDVVKQVQKEIWNLNVDDKVKINMVDKCGEIEFRMVEGSDEFIQLEALLAGFMRL